VNCELHALFALPPGNKHFTHCLEDWLGPAVSLNRNQEKKIHSFSRGSHPWPPSRYMPTEISRPRQLLKITLISCNASENNGTTYWLKRNFHFQVCHLDQLKLVQMYFRIRYVNVLQPAAEETFRPAKNSETKNNEDRTKLEWRVPSFWRWRIFDVYFNSL
jgi:hypothetical protein